MSASGGSQSPVNVEKVPEEQKDFASELQAKLAKLDKIPVKRGRDSDPESEGDDSEPKPKPYTETEPVFLGDDYRRIGYGWHVHGDVASFRIAKWLMRSDKWEPDYQKKVNLNVKELKALFNSMDKILEEGERAHKLEKERLAAEEKRERDVKKRKVSIMGSSSRGGAYRKRGK